jgi:hypothetical protein
MDAKQAVGIAKDYIADLFAPEQIRNLGLEEVEFDQGEGVWFVTIGFARPWEQSGFLARSGLAEPRSFKILRISNEDGRVFSVKDRRPVAA